MVERSLDNICSNYDTDHLIASKLALSHLPSMQIQLILSVEDILPAKLRRSLVIDEELIYPNKHRELTVIEVLIKKLHLRPILPKGIEIAEVLKRNDVRTIQY